jgi:hypothetical protein
LWMNRKKMWWCPADSPRVFKAERKSRWWTKAGLLLHDGKIVVSLCHHPAMYTSYLDMVFQFGEALQVAWWFLGFSN